MNNISLQQLLANTLATASLPLADSKTLSSFVAPTKAQLGSGSAGGRQRSSRTQAAGLQAIQYREILPGQKHFDCDRLSAMLSTITCAERHALALKEVMLGTASACLRCPLGAMHAVDAGAAVTSMQPDTGTACVRCGRQGLRILPTKGVCVSCANREAEWRKGINRKGQQPANFLPLTLRRTGVTVDAQQRYRLFESQNAIEPLACARRAGLDMHTEHPGVIHWSAQRQRFEYRDKSGRPLKIQVTGDRLEYLPCAKHDQPASVLDAGLAMHPEAWLVWLVVSGEILGAEWMSQSVICDQCRHAPLLARCRAGLIECRCPACGVVGW